MSELTPHQKAIVRLDPLFTDPGDNERWLELEILLIECCNLSIEERRFLQIIRIAQRAQEIPEGILTRAQQDAALESLLAKGVIEKLRENSGIIRWHVLVSNYLPEKGR